MIPYLASQGALYTEIDFNPPPITTLFAFSFIDLMGEVAPGVVVKMKYVQMAHKILIKINTDKDQHPHINIYHELSIVTEQTKDKYRSMIL